MTSCIEACPPKISRCSAIMSRTSQPCPREREAESYTPSHETTTSKHNGVEESLKNASVGTDTMIAWDFWGLQFMAALLRSFCNFTLERN